MSDRVSPSPDPPNSPAPDKFSWPPRQPPAHVPPAASELPARPQPPRPAVSQLRSQPRAQALPRPDLRASPLARAWADIERAWFDVTAAPLARRMAEEYWVPDAPTDYCPRCALSVEPHEAVGGLCSDCQAGETKRPPWDRIVRLGEYDPPLSRWICEVKFTRWRTLGRELGRVLGESIRVQLATARAAGLVPEGPPTVVPVPLNFWRHLARGIDHTHVVASGVAEVVGGRVVQPLTRDLRPSQTRVAPSSRVANVAGTFRPKKPFRRPKLGDGLVIVLDDVATTGSTLRGACRAVEACLRSEADRELGGKGGKPPSIWGAVLARTPPEKSDAGREG